MDVEYGTTPESFEYFLCTSCDALSIHPLPDQRLSEIYPPNYYSFAGGDASGRGVVNRIKKELDRRRFRKVIELVGQPAPRLLDVGGGEGDIVASLVAASGGTARATVVDFDEESIDLARAHGLEGVVARFEDFETDARFDVVLMLNLVEHVANPVAVMSKAASLLTPNGVVWIQTPNFRSLDARLFRKRNWGGLHCPRHWVIFSSDGLRRALGKCGLEPVSFRHTQAGSFWAASLLGLGRDATLGSEPVKPLIEYRSYMPIAGVGAGFDFATAWLRKTSQVVTLARPSSRSPQA